jgi:hypothetical protein
MPPAKVDCMCVTVMAETYLDVREKYGHVFDTRQV